MNITRRALLAAGGATLLATGAPASRALQAAAHPGASGLERYREASDRGLAFLRTHLQSDGSYGADIDDLASYYKSPYLYLIGGELERGHLLLDHIAERFMRTNGDFATADGVKSANAAYGFYTMYPNTWVTLAAHKYGRFDISHAAYEHLLGYRDAATGGYRGGRPDGPAGPAIDLIATSAMTLLALYFGDTGRARTGADVLERFIDLQPHLDRGLLLRMTPAGELVDRYPDEDTPYYLLDARQPQQWYFMAGYPLAVLALVHRTTGGASRLDAARRYYDFAERCAGVREYFFSHKVAWGAALLYVITGEPRYRAFAADVCDHLVAVQDASGAWLADQPPVYAFDQTAECAIWLREIAALVASADTAAERR